MKKYHFVYRTHNLINGKEYTGKHSTNDLNDGYYGSGPILKQAILKYGIENFAIEILSFHNSEYDALNEEARIVDEDYIQRDDTYNLTLGGVGTFSHIDNRNKINVFDHDGSIIKISKDDHRWKSKELKSVIGYSNKGLSTYRDKDGNTLQASIDDPRVLSGELVGLMKGTTHIGPIGKVSVKDSNDHFLQVDKDDQRFISGELVGVNKNIPIKPSKDMSCPYCRRQGKSRGMISHIRHCKLNPNQIPFNNNMKTPSKLKICRYCNKEFRARGYSLHIMSCKNK